MEFVRFAKDLWRGISPKSFVFSWLTNRIYLQVFRHIGPESPADEIALKKAFCDELSGSDENNDIMAVTLLKMITAFCNGTSQHFPVKKLLLLLWKTLILSLGGIEELKVLRAAAREKVRKTKANSAESSIRQPL